MRQTRTWSSLCHPAGWLLPAFLCASIPGDCEAQAPASREERPAFKLLRDEEDWSFLRDARPRDDPFDALKYIPIGRSESHYLTLGGEIRERYEYFDDFLWGQGPQDRNGYLLQRYMGHADLHLGPRWRFFGQVKSGIESGRVGGPRPPDEDRFDLHQAWAETAFGRAERPPLRLRLGRQEMQYGSARLVSTREGPNVRQSFDAARLVYHGGPWRIDGFASRPVRTQPGIWDDGPETATGFWGLYAVRPFRRLPGGNLDLYYLGLSQRDAQFDQGIAHEVRHSVGSRLWGRTADWDYNTELVYQFGRFGRGDIRAWTVATDTGYTFRKARFRPRLGLRADIASGDRNPNDQDLGTFNALFPRGSYFSEAGLVGPANFFDIHPTLDLHLHERLTLTLDSDFLWRQSTRDGIYGNAVNLIRSGRGSRERYIGNQTSITAVWRAQRHLSFTATYTHFFAGPFIRESGPGRDVDYLSVWGTFRF